jgi:hypothetical protein
MPRTASVQLVQVVTWDWTAPRAKAAEYYRRHIEVFKNPDPQIARQVEIVRRNWHADRGADQALVRTAVACLG